MQDNLFRKALLTPSMFPVTWELVPGRGARETAQENILIFVSAIADKAINAKKLTENKIIV